MKYLIGIDGGSQSTKVVIFQADGRIVAEGRQPLKPLLLGENGSALHPGDDLWETLVQASRQAMERFPGRRSDIIGVGLCTIRCCRVLLKSDGSLAYPVLSWMDRRLSRPYEPEIPGVSYVTTTSGYITHRLTGQFRDTAANQEVEWPLDREAWRWSDDPAVLERYQIPRSMLFDLVLPGHILGTVTAAAAEATGLPAGLPVAATANDKAVEALGVGFPAEGAALISLGTYITSMIDGPRYVNTAQNYWTNLASVPHRYLYESTGVRRGMSTVSWVRELLGGDVVRAAESLGLTPDGYLNRLAAEIPPGSEGLLTVPDWLAPAGALFKRGLMIGFTGRHTGVHLYRSVLEAIALTMYNHYRAMALELGRDADRLVLSGGGSNGELFMQIFADVFGRPALRTEVNGAVSLGSAICAAVGLGMYGGFDEAAGKMVHPRDTFQPNQANTDFYRRLNEEVYARLTDHTDEVLKKAYAVFG